MSKILKGKLKELKAKKYYQKYYKIEVRLKEELIKIIDKTLTVINKKIRDKEAKIVKQESIILHEKNQLLALKYKKNSLENELKEFDIINNKELMQKVEVIGIEQPIDKMEMNNRAISKNRINSRRTKSNKRSRPKYSK